ncbi:MAG: hypothetical protein ACODAD_15320 [Planctomycetota bacterium]
MAVKGLFRAGTLMNRPVHIGIMVAIAVHMACGCCWHHAHASHGAVDRSVSVESPCPCNGHGHHHDRRPSDPAHSESGGNEQECKAGSCHFTRQDPPDSSDCLVDVYCIPINAHLTSLSALSGMNTRDSNFSGFDQPVPLHLQHQVLLI